jgi:hypothetical protein
MKRIDLKKKLLDWQSELEPVISQLIQKNNPSDDDLLGELEVLYDALDAVICGELRHK